MHRSAPRITRILAACAAVPVILAAAGCSSDSGDGGKGGDEGKKDTSAQSSAAPDSGASEEAATVKAAAYAKLPEACEALSGKTIDALVPKAEKKSGKAGRSDNIDNRASCSWNGVEHKGTKGSQYRWLAVSLHRFDSNETVGSGDDQAKDQLTKKAAEPEDDGEAKNLKSEPLKGVGDEAVLVTFETKKKEGDFKDRRIVARVENALVVVDYSGAGLAGDKAPDAGKLTKDATTAAKEAVTAVTAANDPEAEASAEAEASKGEKDESAQPDDKAKDKAKDEAKDEKDAADSDEKNAE
ncbi:DUF3558 domain-containing protein [Streptomyces sp. O3]